MEKPKCSVIRPYYFLRTRLKELRKLTAPLIAALGRIVLKNPGLHEWSRLFANYCLFFLQIDKLQPQLSQGTEQSSAETGHELANKHQSELDNLASHLCQEKDRAQEFAKECNVLKTSLEKLENANKGSDNETHKLRLGLTSCEKKLTN